LKGVKPGDRTYKNQLDGYNQMDLLLGKEPSAGNPEQFRWRLYERLYSMWILALRTGASVCGEVGGDGHEFSPLPAPATCNL
jgi:hypothetical protein